MLKSPQDFNHPFYSREKELENENNKLKHELKSARQLIVSLNQQIEELKNELHLLQIKNQRLIQQCDRSSKKDVFGSSRKSKSPKSIKLTKDFNQQMEVFTSESDSQTEENLNIRPVNSVIHPLGKEKNKNLYFQSDKGSSLLVSQKGSEIKLRGKTKEKSLKKIDSSNLFRPLTYFDVDPNEDKTFSTINSRPLIKQNTLSMSSNNATRSQKLISNSNNNQNSNIKAEGKISFPNHQKVFKKVSIGKPIYDVFFVTGLSSKNQPEIIFSFPKSSEHFGAILAICYSDDFVKSKENNTASSKNLLNLSSNQTHTGKIKDFYVIPLRKLDSNSENQRQYLTICEVQEVILLPKQNMLFPCVFQRLYCFISGSQFFSAFKNLLNQFLDKINGAKSQSKQPYLSEQRCKDLLKQCLQQPLTILSQKSAQSNHALNYRLDSFVSISIDIPSVDNSYKLVSQYQPWNVMNFKVQIRPNQEYISSLQTKLFGILLVYALSEKKVILFSTVKSKISECILHLLQIIKPLQYVCPIIMTVLKEQHEEYFSAPMSLLLGLWVEQKKMQRQKIQIFMNRKQNLAGMIQKGKMGIQDGIIINLDTGLVYGGGLLDNITAVGVALNQYQEDYCHNSKDVFKLFEKLFSKELAKNEIQMVEIKHKLSVILQGTQLYTYFKERCNRIHQFSP